MTKKCPYCAEEVQQEAIRCKHCNSDIGDEIVPMRMVIWSGSPAWPAFFKAYLLTVIGALLFAVGVYFVTDMESLRATGGVRALLVATPFMIAAVAFLLITLVRRSTRVRISDRSIEVEQGLISKNIDVVEMRRVSDVRFKQSVFERVFSVASIEITVKDMIPPTFVISGLPASRVVFEKIRDRLEAMRATPSEGEKPTA